MNNNSLYNVNSINNILWNIEAITHKTSYFIAFLNWHVLSELLIIVPKTSLVRTEILRKS